MFFMLRSEYCIRLKIEEAFLSKYVAIISGDSAIEIFSSSIIEFMISSSSNIDALQSEEYFPLLIEKID